ncbi:aldehyde dehydrogenase family protein [Cryptosporangium aurantiacum]|uniref:Aldehyde dehydrogenase (NAD+) n=1 Tax=Cryptosporangium aurantiacum TaxID=134849 RepID=A0A1M7PMH5_9ACTN|nr:aldehyde dehydrogenase family protein [Cryptosporangium aurantiacum]SHN18471.1 aldehyde dehydrogenase (NAD+) [Cryptosporangium aurantiacum]
MTLPAFTPEPRLLIDGKLVESSDGSTFDNVNPATEEVLGQVANGTKADMQRAIGAARRAFDEGVWATDRAFRRRCLEQLQTALESEREQLRAELVAEAGTPVALTYAAQLDWPLADALTWPAAMIDEFEWERELPDGNLMGRAKRAVRKEPIGAIGAVVPWNFPFEVTVNKLGPILAMGNTVVLKPAPDTPWNATRLGRLIAEHTEIPAGVVNVVASADHLVGEELTLDPRIDLISFTGSTTTGKRIMERGAATLKRVFLELGGKSAMIVCDDADFAAVLPGAGIACMHAGQGCALQTRILLPRSRYAEGVEILTQVVAGIPYGDPTDLGTLSGPQVSALQRDRVQAHIDRAIADGARLVVGGGRPAHLTRGWFIEPTLFVDVDNSSALAQQEVFGPVLAVIPYDDDADAVRIANDSPYGLSGGVYSASTERALRLAGQIRTGSIGVNGGLWYGADAPYGGYRSSGIGRQNGIEGLEMYTETKLLGWPA